eukprot:SAG22_NODE_205_length_15308_cov_20.539023_11_plen_110_part_00
MSSLFAAFLSLCLTAAAFHCGTPHRVSLLSSLAVPHTHTQVGLTEKVHVVSGSLSGGMKRKLSLAMALIGDCKAIFLDEPTSGTPETKHILSKKIRDYRRRPSSHSPLP